MCACVRRDGIHTPETHHPTVIIMHEYIVAGEGQRSQMLAAACNTVMMWCRKVNTRTDHADGDVADLSKGGWFAVNVS
eukprot:COSAG02_NODE_1315_length_13314_cov_30.517291_6_plen_78_part_00